MGSNTPDAADVDRITGAPRTVRDLFTARKYGVDYYQREYAWTQANVQELLDDLSGRFLDSWKESHERQAVRWYRPYFLGPVVTNSRGGTLFLVDGQQRLTTLSLVLMYLHHLQNGRPDAEYIDVRSYIASTQFGKYSFNLDIDDRRDVMQALLQGVTPSIPAGDESLANLWARYQDIERLFAQELKGAALPYFIDWLLERVAVVEITTGDQEMALEIFETMNDRGLRLTTTDMLKSYLLAMIGDADEIIAANRRWRGRVAQLSEMADKGDSDFIRNWLRGKYAETIRERHRDALPGDFDIIGTAPHKWVRDHREEIGLIRPPDFAELVNNDFEHLSSRYLQLLHAAQVPTRGFEEVFYNAWNGFTFQYPLILATLSPADDDEIFRIKAQMVAGWVDIFIARRIVNYRNFGYSTVAYTMFNLMKDIRDLEVEELSRVLGSRIAEMEDRFDAVTNLRLHQRNGNQVRYLLARMTAWVEEKCGTPLTFAELVNRDRRSPFEIEHIWANHPEWHPEIQSEQAFADQRNSFGGLLLLPKDFNASFGDDTYAVKLEHYFAQNLLARSLHARCYENNPTFLRLVSDAQLPFKPISGEFTAESFAQRQALYQRLCELIWDPASFGLTLPEGAYVPPSDGRQKYIGVTLGDLISAQLIQAEQRLIGTANGRQYSATITPDAKMALEDGRMFDSPSKAGAAALEASACNGWHFWGLETSRGWVRLSRLRDQFLERRRG
jgi:uncharacterized protein with ParB-like and HNH nuclease domain